MKKQTLLGAIALTTLAAAGQAGAGTLTAGTVTGTPTVTGAISVANDIKISEANQSGTVGLVFTPTKSAILPSGNAIISVEIKGGATFGAVVTPGAIVKNTVGADSCAPTTVVSTGGLATDKAVSFLVSGLNGCTNGVPLHALLPLKLDGTNAPVNFEMTLKTEAGTPIDGGTASTYVSSTKTDLIGFKNALTITTKADTTLTQALLDKGFKTLTADVTLGTVEVAVDETQLKGIAAASGTVAATDVQKATFTLEGDLTTVDAKIGGETFKTVDGKQQATVAVAAGTHTLTLALKATNPVIKASTYSLQTALQNTLAATTEFTDAALKSSSVAVEALTREGANYLLPWVASGTLAATSTSNTVVRLANTGEITGPVSVELLTSSKGVAASTSLVQIAPSIAKGGELVITSGDFEAKLGADFGRGDIRITVEGQPSNLIVRRFVQSTTTGALSEVSLGRDAGGNEPRN
jgi:hypothetical protein